MSKGYVYILRNPSMPGLLKIGRTIRSVEGRANELYQTGVPTPFNVAYSILSPDCEALEASAHIRFAKDRVSDAREFFYSNLADVIDYLDSEVRTQVEYLIEEYMPDHHIVPDDEFIGMGNFKQSFYDEVKAQGLFPPDLVRALYDLEGDEAAPAIARIKADTDRRIAEYQASKEAEGATIQ